MAVWCDLWQVGDFKAELWCWIYDLLNLLLAPVDLDIIVDDYKYFFLWDINVQVVNDKGSFLINFNFLFKKEKNYEYEQPLDRFQWLKYIKIYVTTIK